MRSRRPHQAIHGSPAAPLLSALGSRCRLASAARSAPLAPAGDRPGLCRVLGRRSVVTAAAGTVSLQILGPDGSTFVNAASFTANGTATVDLRAGKYQVTI